MPVSGVLSGEEGEASEGLSACCVSGFLCFRVSGHLKLTRMEHRGRASRSRHKERRAVLLEVRPAAHGRRMRGVGLISGGEIAESRG
jgi:hypothetical protein